MSPQSQSDLEIKKGELLSGLFEDANYFRTLEMFTPLVDEGQNGDLNKLWIELEDEGIVEIDSIQVSSKSGSERLFRDVFLTAKGRQVAREGYLNYKNRLRQERLTEEKRREELHQAQLTQARSSTTQAKWSKVAGWVAAISLFFSVVTWWQNDRDVDRLSAALDSTNRRLSVVGKQLDTLKIRQAQLVNTPIATAAKQKKK